MAILVPAVPVVGLLLDDLKAAQKNAVNFCRDNYGGQAYTNIPSGDLILVSSKGIKHTLHAAKPTLIRSMHILPDIIQAAAKTGTVLDKKGRPDIVCVHKYEADMLDDGHALVALLVVCEDNRGSKTFYDLSFLKR